MPVSPSTELYAVGRGVLSIGEWTGTTPPTSLSDAGSCQKFDVEVNEEEIKHYSRRSGRRVLDKIVILETGYTCTFELDEISEFNLKVFLRGTLSAHVIKGGQNIAGEFALKFVTDNQEGPNQTWQFWRCKISPSGAFNLLSDEFQKMSFKAEGLADTANHSGNELFEVEFVTTTTSA